MDFGAHFVEIGFALFVAYVGYALGKSDLLLDPMLTAVTGVVALILHGTWQLALPHRGIDWIAAAVARPPQSPTMVAVALVESAGIWLPVLLIHWAPLRTRLWAMAYVIGAAAVGAFAYYAPSFDPPSLPHPEYGVWLALAFMFAAGPFAIGCIVKRRQRIGIRRHRTAEDQ